jgi:hypothetical protein
MKNDFLHFFVLFSFLSEYFSQHFFSYIFHACFSLRVQDQVSHTWETTGKIIRLYSSIWNFFGDIIPYSFPGLEEQKEKLWHFESDNFLTSILILFSSHLFDLPSDQFRKFLFKNPV